jgi:hypothetical protein
MQRFQVLDRGGRPLDDDLDEVPDGGFVRVPMPFRDGRPDVPHVPRARHFADVADDDPRIIRNLDGAPTDPDLQ